MNIPLHVTHLEDQRRGDSPQLWMVGCSITHGVGVEQHQRYGELLTQRLGLATSWLSRPGSSIMYHADQIIRSDIREHDIVVWGLTEPVRYFVYHEEYRLDIGPGFTSMYKPNVETSLEEALAHPPNTRELERMVSCDSVYQSVSRVLQVKNYCDKIGSRLILVDLFNTELHDYFQHWPNYVRLINIEKANSPHEQDRHYPFFDSAPDPWHPGPLTHQWYADSIYKKFFTQQPANV